MYDPSHNITGREVFKYFEADIVATVPYPTGVKMILATFPALFGTAAGARLQAWCASQGWVLVWALGPNVRDTDGVHIPAPHAC